MFFKIAAKGRNEWYLYLFGFFAVTFGYFLGQVPLSLALYRAIDQHEDLGMSDLMEFNANPDFSKFYIHSNMGFVLLLAMFVFALLALFGVFKLLHKRNFKTLITWNTRVNWKKIFYGFGFWLALGLILELTSYFMDPGNYTFHYRWQNFVPLLLLSILILPIQTSFEEILFRGYFMQGLGLVFKNKWMPLLATTILFGLIHSMNPEIEKFGFFTMQCYYLTAGLLLGIVTVLDDGLELALGIHAATNFIGAVFVGYEGAAVQTDALFKVSQVNPIYMVIGISISAIIFLMVSSRVFKWPPLSSIFRPIDFEEESILK